MVGLVCKIWVGWFGMKMTQKMKIGEVSYVNYVRLVRLHYLRLFDWII